MASATARSISAELMARRSTRSAVIGGTPATAGGQSHSCVRPTSRSASPTAATISVALGRRETILTAAAARPGATLAADPASVSR